MVLRSALAACAAMLLYALTPAQAQQPQDPRALIVRDVQLTPASLLANAQVSPLRATAGPQLGDALACLRLEGERPAFVAVFFEAGKVIDYRRAVALDRCEGADYSPLPVLVTGAVSKPRRPEPSGTAKSGQEAKASTHPSRQAD